jgi:hypothetical protein
MSWYCLLREKRTHFEYYDDFTRIYFSVVNSLISISLKETNDLKSDKFHKLTPWSRALLEKLTVAKLVTVSLPSCGTRKFTAVVTAARHWNVSRAS